MLTDLELKEILHSLDHTDDKTKSMFSYDELKKDAALRKAEKKAVITYSYLLKTLNNIDKGKDNEKYYKINPNTLLKKIFLFLEE